MIRNAKSRRDIDGGWAWMVLFGTGITQMVFVGQATGVGVFYMDIQRELNVSVVEVSVIGALRNGFLHCSVVLTSPLTNALGCRSAGIIGGILASASFLVSYLWTSMYAYYLFLGALTGLSSAFAMAGTVLVINKYFEKRRNFGLITMGVISGTGMLVWGPFTSFLLDHYGLQGALLINGGISLHMVVGALLYFPQNIPKASDKTSLSTVLTRTLQAYKDKSTLCNPMFRIFLISSFLQGFSIYVPILLMTDFLVSQNISLDIASLTVTIIGATSTLSRLIQAFTSNNFPRLNRFIYMSSGVLGGLSLCFVPTTRNSTIYFIIAATFGYFYGILSILALVLIAELFGPQNYPTCYGVFGLIYGIGAMTGNPIASAIAEAVPITGIEYVVSGVTFMLSGLFLLPTMVLKERQKWIHSPVAEDSKDEEKTLLIDNNLSVSYSA